MASRRPQRSKEREGGSSLDAVLLQAYSVFLWILNSFELFVYCRWSLVSYNVDPGGANGAVKAHSKLELPLGRWGAVATRWLKSKGRNFVPHWPSAPHPIGRSNSDTASAHRWRLQRLRCASRQAGVMPVRVYHHRAADYFPNAATEDLLIRTFKRRSVNIYFESSLEDGKTYLCIRMYIVWFLTSNPK